MGSEIHSDKTIWTIGHSTRSLEDLINLLNSFNIELLADIRSYPGSKRFPHFNKEMLSVSLEKKDITYLHMPELGGRRKPLSGSKNFAWQNSAFRGYADYMDTPEFKKAIGDLEKIALQKRTAYMCSEAVWWRCHRSLVSDYLKANGWNVQHIMAARKSEEHPYTVVARGKQGSLF